MQDLISAKFALENLFSKPNTVFLDATFHLPNSGRNALDEFNKAVSYTHLTLPTSG